MPPFGEAARLVNCHRNWQAQIDKANHFYLMRNKIIHERASVGISDNDVSSYRETVQAVLKVLFNLRFT